MDLSFSRKAAAVSLADASYDPKRLALLHMGASLLLNLVLLVLNFLVDQSIQNATGLEAMGNRAVLSTVQSVLSFAGSVALPFWQLGFFYAALELAQNRSAKPESLTEGFRRFGPAARLFLFQMAITFAVVFVSLQVGSILFSFTPGYAETLRKTQDILEAAQASGVATVDEALLMELLPEMTPAYILGLIVLLILGIPLFYRFRLAQFALMDDAPGARSAMAASARYTRGNRLSLFKLDLQFWWYYLAQLVFAGVAYLDVLLPAVGVTLPVSAEVLFFGSFALHAVLQLGLAWAFAAKVQTAYAHSYFALKAATPPPPQAPQMPQVQQT